MANISHVETGLPHSPVDEHHHISGLPLALGVTTAVLAIACVALGVELRSERGVIGQMRTQLAQANAETGGALDNLTKERAVSEGLRGQLTALQVQEDQTKAELNAARSDAAALKSRLTAAQSSAGGLQFKLDAAASDAADLRTKIAGLEGRNADLQGRLDGDGTQIESLQSQLKAAQANLARVGPNGANTLPVLASFDRSFWDHYYSLRLRNASNAALRLDVKISGSQPARAQGFTLEADDTASIRGLHAGDTITITSSSYDVLKLVVP